jgi:uncharacterized membrane protein
MVAANSSLDGEVSHSHPVIHKIGIADLREVLAKGLDDFAAMPTHSVFVIVIYPIMGLILLRLGPFAAIGLYEMSRRRELGLPASLDALSVFSLPRLWPILVLGIVLMVIFLAWLMAAMAIYSGTFNNWYPTSIGDFANRVFATPAGWTLILVGCGVGFCFAVVALAISVVSFPMLVDRDVSPGLAAATSIRAVAANPITMAVWGFIVAAALVIGSLPVLVGLAIVLPVLGHSTWHLYRKVVEPGRDPNWQSRPQVLSEGLR